MPCSTSATAEVRPITFAEARAQPDGSVRRKGLDVASQKQQRRKTIKKCESLQDVNFVTTQKARANSSSPNPTPTIRIAKRGDAAQSSAITLGLDEQPLADGSSCDLTNRKSVSDFRRSSVAS